MTGAARTAPGGESRFRRRIVRELPEQFDET